MDYWRDGILKGIGYWIYDFQTLIAGLFALATLTYMWGNARASKNRKLWHAKSEANFALSELYSALEPIVKSLEADLIKYRKARETSDSSERFILGELPAYPKDSIRLIGSLIPFSKQRDATQIAELVSLLQVYQSRLNNFVRDCNDSNYVISEGQFYDKIWEQVELANWIDRLFPYVRNLRSGSIADFEEEPSKSILFNSKMLFNNDLKDIISGRPWPPRLNNLG